MNGRQFYTYEFGPFRIDVAEGVLRRGTEIVPLNPKAFDTLLALVRDCGRVVPKEELLKAVWPDSYVEEGSLTQNISVLRKALEGTDGGRKYIETVPRRGYRFVADVHEMRGEGTAEAVQSGAGAQAVAQADEPAEIQPSVVEAYRQPTNSPPGARQRGWKLRALMAGALLLVAAASALQLSHQRYAPPGESPKSIAVLPFKSITEDGGSDLTGLGMSDAIALKLGGLKSPTVLPASSVFGYVGREADAHAVGRELGVEAVLSGAVQRAGDRVRVTAQLIRVSDGRVLWSRKFDTEYGDVFAAQDSIAEQVAEAITPALTPEDRGRLAKRSTQNTEAYQAYITGVYFAGKRTEEGIAKALDYFQRAIEDDPNYAPAYAGLSDCYFLSSWNKYDIVPAAEAQEKAEAAALKSMELDDTLPEAHLAMATVKISKQDYERAGDEYRLAINLNPNFAIARLRYANFLFYSGHLDQALQQMRRAQELDPVSPLTNGALGSMLITSRQYDEAVKYCRLALELDPLAPSGHYNLGEAYLQKGRYDDAIAELQMMPEPRSPEALQALAYAYAVAGRRAEAETALADILRSIGRESAEDSTGIAYYNIALIYAALGDHERAFAWLDKERINSMLIAALKYDPQLDALRSDPRFADFIRRRNLQNLLASPDERSTSVADNIGAGHN
jgi:DNA-binding winged helix-turn-helix (wHTH) protein/TolB-like protein/Tfp pilus assembly protein PilF